MYETGNAGLHVTSRRPCWWSRAKAFSPLGTKLYFHIKFYCVDPPKWSPCHVVAKENDLIKAVLLQCQFDPGALLVFLGL